MDAATLYQKSRTGLFFIAGPCVLESLDLGTRVAESLAETGQRLQVPVIFKSSFDKANRSSLHSFRGPGLDTGLEWLALIKQRTGLAVTTDIHLPDQAAEVAEVVDVLQIPAFLCRQTDLLRAAAATGRIVNVKKGQFLAPWDMGNVADKLRQSGCSRIWLTERGTAFGYNNLVVDFRSIPIMQGLGQPVIFDATHSVQLPGGQGGSSGGQREFVPVLAKAAAAVACDGLFLEVHPEPDKAMCDGPNSWPLPEAEKLMRELIRIGGQAHAG